MWPFCRKENHIRIDNIEVNIDYDKLAEAIVRAQLEASKQKGRPSRFRASLMSVLNATLYSAIFLFCIVLIVAVWIAQIDSLITQIICTVLFVFTGVYSAACFFESLHDSDKGAQEHFNSNVALIAMVIALITLLRGGR